MAFSIVLGLPLLAGCGDAAAPTMASVAGTYAATVFTVQEGTAPTDDLLAQGAFINLTLRANGSTAGRAFIPDGGEDGGDLDVDLSGTWTLTSQTVTLDHPADTFLRDMSFTSDRDRLVGQATFGNAAIAVEFTRQ